MFRRSFGHTLRRSPLRRGTPLSFDDLEPRMLLACTETATDDGTLSITGDEFDNIVRLRMRNENVRVLCDGDAHVFAGIQTVDAKTLDGNDVVSFAWDVDDNDDWTVDVETGEGDDRVRFDWDIDAESVKITSRLHTGGGNDLVIMKAKWYVPEMDADSSGMVIDTADGDDLVSVDLQVVDGKDFHFNLPVDTGPGNDNVRFDWDIDSDNIGIASRLNTAGGDDVVIMKAKWYVPELDSDQSGMVVDTAEGNDLVWLDWEISGKDFRFNLPVDTGSGDDDVRFDFESDAEITELMTSLDTGRGRDRINLGFQLTEVSLPGPRMVDAMLRIAGGDDDDQILVDLGFAPSLGSLRVLLEGNDGDDSLGLRVRGGGPMLARSLRLDGGPGVDRCRAPVGAEVVNCEQ